MKKSTKIIMVVVILFLAGFYIYRSNSDYLEFRLKPYELSKEEAIAAINEMDKEGLYRDSQEWKDNKDDIVNKIDNSKHAGERVKILNEALNIIGGKNSAIFPIYHRNYEKYQKEEKPIPTSEVIDNVLFLKLPSICFDSKAVTENGIDYNKSILEYDKFIEEGLKAIRDNKDVLGYVIDLTDNGSTETRMTLLLSVSSLLNDGDLMKFLDKDDNIVGKDFLDKGVLCAEKDGKIEKIDKYKNETKVKKPICVIVNEKTLASAEYLTLVLKDNANAKIIGTETMGLISSDKLVRVNDGLIMILTDSKMLTPKGKEKVEYKKITPDIVCDEKEAKDKALEYILQEVKN